MKHVTVTEAHDLQSQGHVYVDVRSTREFAMGHPKGAVNVPLLEADPATGQMTPNPDFARVMQATFAPDTRLLIGCQAGGRSVRAAQMLEAFGYGDVSNVLGGFGGGRNPMGRGIDQGWMDAGLPVEREAEPGAAYEALLDRADANG
jgi:rhodanese-related sulfurtransferase